MDNLFLNRLCEEYGDINVNNQLKFMKIYGTAVTEPELWLSTALERNLGFWPIEIVDHCPCGSEMIRSVSRFLYFNLLGISQCRKCGLVFISPRLSRESMVKIFEEFYFNNGDPEYWGKRRAPIFKDIMRVLKLLICRTVFDVGTAYGHFIHYARENGLEASGCDIARGAVEWGQEHLKARVQCGTVHEIDLADKSFDSVVSLDTLYYAADPLEELKAMKRLIRPRGYLILRLRNNIGVAARAKIQGKQKIGKPVLPMPHLWAFTPKLVGNLLKRCGFEILLCEPAAYSSSGLRVIEMGVLMLNRFCLKAFSEFPIVTQSFNVVAQLT